EELDPAGQLQQLNGRDGTAAAGLVPGVRRVQDLPLRRHARHSRKLDPLHVSDDGETHTPSLTSRRRRALIHMMEAMTIPPFERFYEEHRDAVFGLLARRLGRQRAEDAFQETFLRALRAYPKLAHTENLRAWVLTI